MAARALGLGLDGPVGRHLLLGDGALSGEELDQLLKRSQLFSGWFGSSEVADQTNSYPVFIVVVIRCLAVRAVFLLVPPRAYLDRTIGRIGAIADHKVITKLVPTVVFAVILVEAFGAARRRGAVVQYDVRPPPTDLPPTRKP